ncbi:MAG TPA: hypothetical protein VFE37_10490 [Chloroflexota bacterium]|nr:hypothetical protein [Chloroflexota bacterium]
MAKPHRAAPTRPAALKAKGGSATLPPIDNAEAAALAAQVRAALDDPAAALGVLVEAPAPLAAAALESVRREAGAAAVPLLARAAEQAAAPVADVAVSELGALADPAAATALARLDESVPDKERRKAARRALFRLRSQGVQPLPEAPSARAAPATVLQPRATLYRAVASQIDGLGSRGLSLYADRPLGGAYLFSVLLNDLAGMKDFFVRDSTRKRLAAREEEMREQGGTWVELPIPYAQWLIQEALALNAESGFPVPLEYRQWQDVIGAPPQPYERPLAYEEVSRFEVKMRPELLEHSPELFEEPEVEHWLLGYRDVQKYAAELRRAAESRLVLTPESDEQRAERVLAQAIREVFTAPLRRALQRRLEETAYIFLRTERPQAAKLAIAAAVEIADSDPVLLPRHPFVRALMQRSIQLAIQADRAGLDPAEFDRSPYDPIDQPRG